MSSMVAYTVTHVAIGLLYTIKIILRVNAGIPPYGHVENVLSPSECKLNIVNRAACSADT